MALRLDGGTNRAATVRYGTMTNLHNLPAPISMAVWIRPITMGVVSLARILAKEFGNNGYLLYLGGTNAFQFAVYYSGSNLNVISNNNILTVGSNAPWQHIASTWDGGTATSSVKLYHNGVLISNNAASTPGSGSRNDDTAASLEIGNRTSTANRGFNGDIAEAGLWNKILTPEEINSLARGYSCKYVGSDKRLFSAPLIRSFTSLERDVSITPVAATVVEHPRIII